MMKKTIHILILFLCFALSSCLSRENFVTVNTFNKPTDDSISHQPAQFPQNLNEDKPKTYVNISKIENDSMLEPLYQFGYSFDGNLIALISPLNQISVTAINGKAPNDLDLKSKNVDYFRWSRTDLKLAIIHDNGRKISIYDFGIEKVISLEDYIDENPGNYFSDIEWSEDGEEILVGLGSPSLDGSNKIAVILNTSTFEVIDEIELPYWTPGVVLTSWNPLTKSDILIGNHSDVNYYNRSNLYIQGLGLSGIKDPSYLGLHWVEEDVSIVIANEFRVPHRQGRVVIKTVSGSTTIDEVWYELGTEESSLSHGVYASSLFNGNKNLLTLDAHNTLSIFSLKDYSPVLIYQEELPFDVVYGIQLNKNPIKDEWLVTGWGEQTIYSISIESNFLD